MNGYFDRRLWHRTANRKKSEPILGALSVTGKDNQGRNVILPTGFQEQTGRKIPVTIDLVKTRTGNRLTIKKALAITTDFMQTVTERLMPYKFMPRAK